MSRGRFESRQTLCVCAVSSWPPLWAYRCSDKALLDFLSQEWRPDAMIAAENIQENATSRRVLDQLKMPRGRQKGQ